MSGMLDWRERPWTMRLFVGIGLVSIAPSLVTQTGMFDVVVNAISLALLAGLWHGNPGVRLFYIFVTFVLVVANAVAFLVDPSRYWQAFAPSLAMLALLLAPPSHRWARGREEQRERKRAQRRAASRV